MNAKRTRRLLTAPPAFLLLVMLLSTGAVQAVADDWAELASRPPAGVSAERWNHLVSHFREKPYSVSEIQPYLTVIAAAATEGLPIEAVLTRLEEGVVKRADAAALERAGRQRLESLRQAQHLLSDTGHAPTATPARQELMTSVAFALESGVPADGLSEVLNLGAGKRGCRLRTSVEAGETLTLMGLDGATATGLMEDFVKRQLCCGEILRATRLAGQQHRAGRSGQEIRETLWKGGAGAPTKCRRHGCDDSK